MARNTFENLEVYRLSERLADAVWDIVIPWGHLARDTVGKQLIRAADGVGANIAEGCGRKSFQDNRRFARIARASLYETQHWLRRAFRRKLLTADQVEQLRTILDELCPRLNAYLNSIGNNTRPPRDSMSSDSGRWTVDGGQE
jgi:four helix bundle protein